MSPVSVVCSKVAECSRVLVCTEFGFLLAVDVKNVLVESVFFMPLERKMCLMEFAVIVPNFCKWVRGPKFLEKKL